MTKNNDHAITLAPYFIVALSTCVLDPMVCVQLMDKPWHVDCVKCTVCLTDMKGKIYKRGKYHWPVCLEHAKSVSKEDEDKLIARQKQWEEILKVWQSRQHCMDELLFRVSRQIVYISTLISLH